MIDLVRMTVKLICATGIGIFLLALVGCASTKPAEIKTITNTQFVVVEVPTPYLTATPPSQSINTGCVSTVDWKECATSRARHIVNLLGDIGQCNADKYKARSFIEEQAIKIKERNKKP